MLGRQLRRIDFPFRRVFSRIIDLILVSRRFLSVFSLSFLYFFIARLFFLKRILLAIIAPVRVVGLKLLIRICKLLLSFKVWLILIGLEVPVNGIHISRLLRVPERCLIVDTVLIILFVIQLLLVQSSVLLISLLAVTTLNYSWAFVAAQRSLVWGVFSLFGGV